MVNLGIDRSTKVNPPPNWFWIHSFLSRPSFSTPRQKKYLQLAWEKKEVLIAFPRLNALTRMQWTRPKFERGSWIRLSKITNSQSTPTHFIQGKRNQIFRRKSFSPITFKWDWRERFPQRHGTWRNLLEGSESIYVNVLKSTAVTSQAINSFQVTTAWDITLLHIYILNNFFRLPKCISALPSGATCVTS